MRTKTEKDEFLDYLTDASNMPGGRAEKLLVPENESELSEILRDANGSGTPVTISGARTGTVGGAVPMGGWIVSLEKLDRLEIDRENLTLTAGAGVLLTEIQKQTDQAGLFYPPDPTEWSCQIGGNAATDASGARSFKFGSTRDYVKSIRVVLANGETVSLKRNEVRARDGRITMTTDQGTVIDARIPTYPQPEVRKNASGFYSDAEVDAVDLFIGSEGLLGVISELELTLLPKPEGFLSGIVFFDEAENLLSFVDEARRRSFENQSDRQSAETIDASLIEYFDRNALDFIKGKFPETPVGKAGAIFFEQVCDEDSEDTVFAAWNGLLEKHGADLDVSWFAVDEGDKQKMLDFRHALPVAVNEKIVKSGQRKIGTDMSVPDSEFRSFLRFYEQILSESGIGNVTFGHIGDSHLHVNLLPANDTESEKARHIYGRCIAQAIMLGGTVSAEHGIGKLKSKYLYVMYGERYINEMAELKHAFDVKSILNRGNMFDEKFLVV